MDHIIIGTILKPQGIRGEVKAEVTLAEGFKNLKAVYLDGEVVPQKGAEPFTVTSVSLRGGFAYILFEGYDTREAADTLRDKSLCIPRAALKLKKGEYLQRDILGCALLDETGKSYGTITDIDSYGAADVYTVADGAKTLRFPFLKTLNAKINVAEKTIIVNSAALTEIIIFDTNSL